MKKEDKPKGSFFRTCTGCGTIKNKYELIRTVRLPNGSVVLDESGKLNGRGGYVCNNSKCIEKALKSGRLSRTLRAKIPEGHLKEYGGK